MTFSPRAMRRLLTIVTPATAILACGSERPSTSQPSAVMPTVAPLVERDVEGCYALAIGPVYATRALAEMGKDPTFEHARKIELSHTKPNDGYENEWVIF